MPKWSNRSSRYTVKITYDKHGRAKATIPAPIIAGLGRPDTLTFELGDGKIIARFERRAQAQAKHVEVAPQKPAQKQSYIDPFDDGDEL